ncbi:Autoinducer 1 sensor kinase/phosphatase LuxN [Dyadobacter sp. CECT 9275]|uniref:Autoinducer 1 sensor kinase/phosphatase LuxN n=1 Tax=Dyadobacter helix TaxID=2822344 RepID=A0A916N6I7_9BACT|nr:response regulator transcription factor [Dyadobacter sp. CECT 9275]CAG5003809.1 Autoinducer 1 sensor kinase/phosphatase LuxN [Dyadobacter sp. CECT 9275]
MNLSPSSPQVGIVDDNPMVRILIRQTLIRNKIDVVFEAIDGLDCIEKMRKASRAPDIIITDLEMPVMSGFDSVGILKENWPGTAIIAFSGITDAMKIQKVIEGGADFFLEKSPDLTELMKLIVGQWP